MSSRILNTHIEFKIYTILIKCHLKNSWFLEHLIERKRDVGEVVTLGPTGEIDPLGHAFLK